MLVSSVETIMALNQHFETAIHEAGGETGLQKVFSGVVSKSNPFVAKLEELGVFKNQAKLEDNVEHLVNTLILAETRLQQKGKNADPQEIRDVNKFGKNLATLIRLASTQSTQQARSLTKPSLLLNRAISKFTAVDRKLQTALKKLDELYAQITSSKAAQEEKSEAFATLLPYEKILKSELGFNIRSLQTLQKNRNATAHHLNAYLTKLEGIENKPCKTWAATLKSYLGYGEQTEFGPANRGSLARGMYTSIYNRLSDCARDIRFIQAPRKFAEALEKAGATLVEAKQLQLALSTTQLEKKDKPEVLQAHRACQLMKLRDFVTKAHFFLETKGKANREATAEFAKLYQLIGIKGNEPFSASLLQSITSAELEKLWNTIATTIETLLSDQDGQMDWSTAIIRDDMSTKSWSLLCSEMINGQERLP